MTSYAIPTDRLSRLQKQVVDLNRRADRLGVPGLTLATTAEWCSFRPAVTDGMGGIVIKPARRWEVTEVDLDGGRIGLAGWTFVGTVEHLDGVNVLRAVPGQEMPEDFRTGRPACDHCGLDRQRNDTFVVRHEDGSVKQLGRSCTADYLGHVDPARLASLLEAVYEAVGGGDGEEDDDERGPRVRETFRPVDVVAVARAAIRQYGWVSAAAAQANVGQRTSGRVSDWLAGGKAYRLMVEAGMDVTADDYEQADAMVTWAAEQRGDDYLRNLAAYASQERVDGKAMGLLASLPSAYDRAMGRIVEQCVRDEQRAAEREAASPAPTGKVTVEGTIVGIKEQEANYGGHESVTTKLTILTTDGWRLWVTEPRAISGAAIGDRVRMVVTVTPSDRDATFAFGSRPSKAEVLEGAQAALPWRRAHEAVHPPQHGRR